MCTPDSVSPRPSRLAGKVTSDSWAIRRRRRRLREMPDLALKQRSCWICAVRHLLAQIQSPHHASREKPSSRGWRPTYSHHAVVGCPHCALRINVTLRESQRTPPARRKNAPPPPRLIPQGFFMSVPHYACGWSNSRRPPAAQHNSRLRSSASPRDSA